MKLLPLLLVLTFPGLASAQETAEPAAPAPAPAATPQELPPLPDPSPESPSDLMRNQPGGRLRPAPEPMLIPGLPGATTRGERPRGRSTLRPPTTSADLDARIRYRQAHSRAANEPALQALWEESREAKTDYLKRDALRRYYTLLYKRMLTFDKGLSALVQERQRFSLRRLDQTRIEPTDPTDEQNRQQPE